MAIDDSWMVEGLCATIPNADTIFFPDIPKGDNGKREYARARAICNDCPVRVHCLAYAIAHRIPYGVWGAMSPPQRRRIPKERRREIRRAWRENFSSMSERG